MRIATALFIAAVLTMALGALTVLANEKDSPDSPSRLAPEEQTQLDSAIEKVSEIESVEEPGNDIELQEVIPPVILPAFPPTAVTLDTVWDKSPDDMSLFDRLIKAVLRSRTLPSAKGEVKRFYWEQGGIPVPEEEMIPLATQWAATFLAALDEVEQQTDIRLPTWGAFATMANEGGFWNCSLNWEARKWASEHSCKKLTTETWHGKTTRRKIETKLVDKFRQTYTCDEVWNIIHDPHYKDAKIQVKGRDGKMKWVKLANKADGGPWQIRFSVKDMSREKFDRLMSMQPGVYLGAREMAHRALSYMPRFRAKEPHPRPWMLWPGWDPFTSRAFSYDEKITMIARYLGARKDEIERGTLALLRLDNSKRESHLLAQ
jgi:hypothetical protein